MSAKKKAQKRKSPKDKRNRSNGAGLAGARHVRVIRLDDVHIEEKGKGHWPLEPGNPNPDLYDLTNDKRGI